MAASEGNGKTILIVDDESDILLVLKRALLRLGADDFGKKPMSAESVVDKILLMLIGEQKVMDAA